MIATVTCAEVKFTYHGRLFTGKYIVSIPVYRLQILLGQYFSGFEIKWPCQWRLVWRVGATLATIACYMVTFSNRLRVIRQILKSPPMHSLITNHSLYQYVIGIMTYTNIKHKVRATLVVSRSCMRVQSIAIECCAPGHHRLCRMPNCTIDHVPRDPPIANHEWRTGVSLHLLSEIFRRETSCRMRTYKN